MQMPTRLPYCQCPLRTCPAGKPPLHNSRGKAISSTWRRRPSSRRACQDAEFQDHSRQRRLWPPAAFFFLTCSHARKRCSTEHNLSNNVVLISRRVYPCSNGMPLNMIMGGVIGYLWGRSQSLFYWNAHEFFSQQKLKASGLNSSQSLF